MKTVLRRCGEVPGRCACSGLHYHKGRGVHRHGHEERHVYHDPLEDVDRLALSVRYFRKLAKHMKEADA